MKKWIICLFALLFLGGCQAAQSFNEKDAAKVFVNAVIYQKDIKLFKENFTQADALVNYSPLS